MSTEPMTLEQASLALRSVPHAAANNTCVQDAQWRLRERLALAGRDRTAHELAPSYVVEAVGWLHGWVDFALARRLL